MLRFKEAIFGSVKNGEKIADVETNSHSSESSEDSKQSTLWDWRPFRESDKPVPIVFDPNFDIHVFYVDKFYVFDIKKWGKIFQLLDAQFKENNFTVICPKRRAKFADLSKIHTVNYLNWVKSNSAIGQIAEFPGLRYIPVPGLLKTKILEPIKWQVAGSVVAAKVAMETKWAINLGGGFHHCSTHIGEGFCFYADITLIMKERWETNPESKFMIVDLDAHQGNGYARDVIQLKKKENVYIIDIFNHDIFPKDAIAKNAISLVGKVDPQTSDTDYLELLQGLLAKGVSSNFKPDLIIYNAGTDCLKGDRLGKLNLSEECIRKRDSIMFEFAKEKGWNIVMLTSGGYQSDNARVIYESIKEMIDKNIIDLDGASLKMQ